MAANFKGGVETTITILPTVVDTIYIREGVHKVNIEFALSDDFNSDQFIVEVQVQSTGSWIVCPTYVLTTLVEPYVFGSGNLAALTKNTSGFLSMNVKGLYAVRFKMALAGASNESGTVTTLWQVR